MIRMSHMSQDGLLQGTSTSFSIQYATGSVSGNVAYDTVNIGGINIPNQALGMVQQAGKELAWSSCDGIIVRFCHLKAL